MNYMLKGLWLIEDGPYVGDTNFISQAHAKSLIFTSSS